MHLIDQQLNNLMYGYIDSAWEISNKLEEQYPNLPGDENFRHKFNRGWLLLSRGLYQEGYQSLEAGRSVKAYGNSPLRTNKPLWLGDHDLTNKVVILYLEAGYGDQIISLRFASEINKLGGKCVVCCHPSFKSLFSRSPYVFKAIDENEVSVTYHDYWVPGFTATWIFNNDYDNLPNHKYIFSNPDSVNIWNTFINTSNLKNKNNLKKKKKVGIRWSGNPKFEHQQFRIFPPEKLIDLLDDKRGVSAFSFQRDNDLRELPSHIVDLNHLLISWEDTAAALENIDLLITSCTSVCHLASAMHIPTWVIVPILPYHTWAYGEKYSPWYPKTRIYRQTKFGYWDDVFEKLNIDLDRFIKYS